MYISAESVCRITGIHNPHFYVLRRYLSPEIETRTLPRKGRGRAKALYPVASIIAMLHSLCGGIDRDTVRRLFEAASPIDGVTA